MDSPSNEEDIQLMSLIAKDDESAFRRLVEKHQFAVIGTISKMTNHSPDSEDIAQQVFLRIWKSAKKYTPKAKFTTFLFTITRNLVFNETKKKQRRNEFSIDQQPDQQLALPDQTPNSPDQMMEKAEMRKMIDQAIAELPQIQRMAIVLRRYENLPYEEIAKVLNISIPAVKSQLFRARTVLKETLLPHLKD